MHAIDCSDDGSIIIGTIESVDDDGMVYVRIAEDCLIMAESVIGELAEGDKVKITLAHEDLLVVG